MWGSLGVPFLGLGPSGYDRGPYEERRYRNIYKKLPWLFLTDNIEPEFNMIVHRWETLNRSALERFLGVVEGYITARGFCKAFRSVTPFL